MGEPCRYFELITPTVGIILRQSAICPKCGKPLALRPDVALAVNLLAAGGSYALGGMVGRGAWIGVAATFTWMAALYLFIVFSIVRFLPMRHVQATDAAASRYRVLITLMLIFCALVIAFSFG
jgi:hypothetical protein